MDYKKLLRKSSTCERVKSILEREFGELPNDCVIAGGAVASAVFETLQLPLPYRYKDLDCFYTSKEALDGALFETPKFRVRSFSARVSCSLEHIGVSAIQKNQITVNGSYMTENNINKVLIKLHDDVVCKPGVCRKSFVIVNSFDINSVEVALTSSKKQLMFTEDFINYLYGRIIKVTNLETPMHSFVRAHEKALLHNTTVCQTSKINLLNAITIYHELAKNTHEKKQTSRDHRAIPGMLFSQSYKERFTNLPAHVKEGVKITPISHTVRTFHSMFEGRTKTLCHYVLEPKCSLSNDATKLLKIADTIGFSTAFDNRFALVNTLSTPNLVKKIVPYDNPQLMTFGLSLITNYPCINLNWYNEKTILDLMKVFANDDRALVDLVMSKVKSQQCIPNIIKNIKFIKNHFPVIIGLMENSWCSSTAGNKSNLIDGMASVLTQSELPRDVAQNLLSDYLDSLGNESVPELFKKDILALNSVHEVLEVTNSKSLFILGEVQRHCVGGYWNLILDAQSYIVTIRNTNGELSTAELRHSTKDGFRIIQHRTKFNQRPIVSSVEEIERFVDLLNVKDWNDTLPNKRVAKENNDCVCPYI
ncbi:PcfJ domain-containing protein [Vibrio barjaei]|uniref:PcfJ domain-containing protein n=1 Tax=Vibrio barjaei TaxID=1676683 RepID=UPI0022846739|nr:PcfJ domain-containing protein [Vibrio barjaei]MCY9870356.1 PcfJ domain-containing protein [Vibrio barjaei]